MKRILSFLFICLLSFAFIGCGEQPEQPGEKTPEVKYSLSISDADKILSLEVGATKQITVTFEGGTLEWASSDSSVVSIEGNKLTALKAGQATVTVSLQENASYKATIEVTVTEPEPVVITHNVIFIDSETGEIFSEQTVKDGEAAVEPVVDNPAFKCWDKDFDEVKEDLIIMTVYGKVSKISYMLSGGSWLNPEDKIASYVEGVGVELKKPVKENYSFAGWSTVKNGTDYITAISSSQTGDVTLYANWKDREIEVEFDFNGGMSTDYFIAQKDKADATIYVDNYNSNGGEFWVNKNYEKYSFIGNDSNDPRATFSDRLYIAKDSETGYYKIVKIIPNGSGSSWATGAEFVITVSSSYKAGKGFSGLHSQVTRLSEEGGQYIIFDDDFSNATLEHRVTAYIFAELPSENLVLTMKKDDKLITGLKILGGTFIGWQDPDGNMITSIDQIKTDQVKLTAKFKLDNPVTAINVSSICEELLTGATFQIVATVEPANAYFKQIFYTSSNTDVLEVSNTGKITAKNVGTAVIKMQDYVKNITVEKTITVYPIDCIDVKFETADGAEFDGILKIGETVKVKALAYGKGVSSPTYTFASSDSNVLTVDASGLVTAIANGKAVIKVTDNTGSNFEVNITLLVQDFTSTEKVDKVLALIAENNFALVEAGNISLMDNGTKRDYVSTYGSVNRFLFSPYVVDRTYESTAESTYQSHGGANANYNCKLRTDWHGGVEFVTVHDTATVTGTVQSIGSYMSTGETSIHYTVGNDQILSVIPEKYIAYHAGDGTGTQFKWYDTGVAATDNSAPEFDMVRSGGKYYFVVNGQTTSIECPVSANVWKTDHYEVRTINNPSKDNFAALGPVWKIQDGHYYMGTTWVDFSQRAAGTIGSHGGNNNSIGIEMCVNYSGDIYDTWQRTAQLVADICLRYNLDLTRVKQHNTWTGKNCPQCLLAADYWWGFMKMVEVNYEIMKNYSDCEITMKSNNPTMVDDTGRVVGRPQTATTVSYDVTVKCGNESKTMTLYSVIPGTSTWTQMDGVYASSKGWKWSIDK